MLVFFKAAAGIYVGQERKNNPTGDANKYDAFYQIWDSSKALINKIAQLISTLKETRDYLWNRDKKQFWTNILTLDNRVTSLLCYLM